MSVTVRDDRERRRYVAQLDREPAGFAAYSRRPGVVSFMHTEVDGRFKGRGVGSAIARAALEDARANREAVLPFCPFINRWIRDHAEYRDLVPAGRRAEFGL